MAPADAQGSGSGQELDQRDDHRTLGDHDAGEPLDQANLDVGELLLDFRLELSDTGLEA
jgi:hypothetical protein